MKTRLAGLLAAALLLPAADAWAHHSFGMFDDSKEVTIEGTVKEFQWTNPHTFIQVMVKDEKTGKLVEWSVEGAPVSSLRRRGWNRNSLKPGAKVKVNLYPARSGGPFGGLASVLLDGKPVGGAAPS